MPHNVTPSGLFDLARQLLLRGRGDGQSSRVSRVELRSVVRAEAVVFVHRVSLIEQQLANFPVARMCGCMEGKVSTAIEAENGSSVLGRGWCKSISFLGNFSTIDKCLLLIVPNNALITY